MEQAAAAKKAAADKAKSEAEAAAAAQADDEAAMAAAEAGSDSQNGGHSQGEESDGEGSLAEMGMLLEQVNSCPPFRRECFSVNLCTMSTSETVARISRCHVGVTSGIRVAVRPETSTWQGRSIQGGALAVRYPRDRLGRCSIGLTLGAA